MLEYLQKGVDAVKNALSTIFHWTDFVTGGSSGDSFVAGNIDASGDIYVAKTETNNMVTIDFGISWYNLDTNEYEQ